MKLLNKAIIPLLMALIGLGVVVFMLPFGVEARQDEPNLGEMPLNPQILSGMDIELSNGTSSSVPKVATSGPSAAVVYVKSNLVYLRWAQTMWSNNRLIHVTKGNTPKVAFLPSTTDTVHIVWSGYDSGGNPQKVIRHRRCRMLVEPTILCGSITDIASTTIATTTLDLPDVAIDSDGHLHVAWFDNSGELIPDTERIKTVRSLAPDNGAGWSAPVEIVVGGVDQAGQPALAASGNFVHLVFKNFVSGTGWQVQYRRTNKTADPHVWGLPNSFGEVLGHDKISNPVIAAGNSKLYLAWDTQNGNMANLDMYGLIGVTNTNGAGVWSAQQDVPGNFVVGATVAPNDKRSQDDSAVPVIERELRPSLALTGTNDFVVVWHERPDSQCHSGGGIAAKSHLNGTSEIYYAESQGNGWTTVVDTLANDPTEYSIDPDIAIDSLGRRHIVFMKATGLTSDKCHEGGSSADYAIYYRGPVLDKWPENPVYLPVVVKNK